MAKTYGKFYGAPDRGADYDFVVNSLNAIFKSQGAVPVADSFTRQLPVPVRPVGLIFGRPACKIFKDELLPHRSYYHLRSGKNVELFYMGYADPDAKYLTVGAFDENNFSNGSFVTAVEDFEERTTWKYSSMTDVILLNSFFSGSPCYLGSTWGVDRNGLWVHKQKAHLDFSNVFAVQLEQSVDSHLIFSGRAFIVEVMRHSRECVTEDVVMRTSDVVFLRNARNTFLSWVMGLVGLKAEDYAYQSCVRDISRHEKAL